MCLLRFCTALQEALLPLDYKDLCFLEEVVQRQAQFYETFLDLVGAPGAVWRRTGDILCCNDAFANMLKSTREELIGANIVKVRLKTH
jgi:PAS domain-containing protein